MIKVIHLSLVVCSVFICSYRSHTPEDKKDILRKPSEASCELAIRETGPLLPVTADWQPQKAPGSQVTPADDARRIWMVLNGWSKLIIPSGSENIRVTSQSLPDQWPSDCNYTHAWYVLQADFGPTLQEKTWLRFDAVAHSCVVFVNGKQAGSHLGGFTPFEFEITSMVQPGLNTVAIWVQDETSVLVGQIENRHAISQMGLHTPRHGGIVNGIRGGVYFEARRSMHVARLRVRPSTREKVLCIETWVRGKNPEGTVKQAVYEWPEGKVPVLELPDRQVIFADDVNEVQVKNITAWEDPKLWSPEHPDLYVLRTTVMAGGRSESFDTRFGFREFWIDGTKFMLNGKPIRLLGDGSHRPDLRSLDPVHSLDYNRKSLEFLKREFNYNSIRFHATLFPSWASLAADEAGYLVINQSAMARKGKWAARAMESGSEELLRNLELQFAEWYWRDVNNASVVIWDVDNEVLRDRRTPEFVRIVLELERFIKELDPEAIVQHSGAGWYHPDQDHIHINMEEQYSGIMREWAASGTVPLILGEWWMGGRGETRLPNGYEYSGREDWHTEEARIYRERMLEMRYHGVSGIMPHCLTKWPLIRLNHELTPFYSLPGKAFAGLTRSDLEAGRVRQNQWRFPELRNLGGRGLAPVVGFVWPRSTTVIAGEPFTREIVVCNDREDEASFTITCFYGSQAHQWQVTLDPAGQDRHNVTFVPAEDASDIIVSVSGKYGEAIEGDRVIIHVIPASLTISPSIQRRIVVFPEIDPLTAGALNELNVPYSVSEEIPSDAANTIVLVTPGAKEDALGRTSAPVRSYLSSGGRLLALEQNQAPEWLPLELPFSSAMSGVAPEFMSGGGSLAQRNKDKNYSREVQVYAPGHPVFNGLKTCDFREWNPVDGRVSDDVFRRPNALNMKAGGEYCVLLGATRRENASLVEFRVGKGTGMLCQAQVLTQRDNPAARTLLFNMLKYLDGPAWKADLSRIGLMGDLSASHLAALTGADENIFVPVTKKNRAFSLVLAGDHADTETMVDLAKAGSTVLVLSCETCARLPGYKVEQGEGQYYSGTRSGVEDHPLFWGVASASFLPLEQTPVQGALSEIPAEVQILLNGHCCGHSPLKKDWWVDIGFWGLESREAAPPIAVLQNTGKGSIVATTIEPWNVQAETHRQLLTNLLANAGIPITVKTGHVRIVEVKQTVPLKFDGLLDDWTNDMDDINISEYTHADPVAITSKDLLEGHAANDVDLSAVVYLLHDREHLYIGGITFSSQEGQLLTLDLSGNTITIDPVRKSLRINRSLIDNPEFVTGRQSASEIIDTRLLNINIIRPGTVEAPTGLSFEIAFPWLALGYQILPDKLHGRFRLSREGIVLQQPVPSDDAVDYIILQLSEQ